MPSPAIICLGLSIFSILLSSSYVNSQISNTLAKREYNLSESILNKNATTSIPQRNFRSTNIWRRSKPDKEKSKNEFSDSNYLKSTQASDDSSANNNVSNIKKLKRGQVKYSDHAVEESKKTVFVSRTRKREELPQDSQETSTKSYKRNIERTTISQIISNMRTYKKNIPKLNVVSTTPRTTTKEYETTSASEEDTFNIDKYTSPEFHDVNNAYRLPLSSEMSYMNDEDDEDVSNEKETYEEYTIPSYTGSTTPSSQSTFDFDLTTPYVHSFDSRFKQVTKDIMQTLHTSKSSSTMYPNTSQEVKKVMNYEELLSNEPNNPSKIYYKNTKKITLSDSDKTGSPSKKHSDVHGTSIYFESSMVATENYPFTTTVEPDCENITTTEVVTEPTTVLTNKALQISLIDSNVVTNEANALKKSNDLSSNDIVTPVVRRMQFTTPKTKRRISMKTKRINPVSPKPPVFTNTNTNDDKSSRRGSLKGQPIVTTISPELDPVYQSDSTHTESDQDISISTLSKRGSMKYTSNGTSSQKLESTLMSIPPTSTAWALITNKYPPTKNRTSAGPTTEPITEAEPVFTTLSIEHSQANKDRTDIPPTATQYMTFSEMFGTSAQTIEPSPETVTAIYSKTRAPAYVPVDNQPWTPIFGGTTNAHSKLPVFNMTSSSQTSVNVNIKNVLHSSEMTSTSPMPSYLTESTTLENDEEYTEKSITVSHSQSSSNAFESITKLPTKSTTPLSEESDNSTTETPLTTQQSENANTSSTIKVYNIEEEVKTPVPDYVTIKSTVTEISTDIDQTTIYEASTSHSTNEDQFTATSDFYNTQHAIANVQSKVPFHTTTSVSLEQETFTKLQDVSPTGNIDNVVRSTVDPLSTEEPEVPITTYRPKYYTTTTPEQYYTTHWTRMPPLLNTGMIDVVPLTTSKPEPTTSDIFESVHSRNTSFTVPTSKTTSEYSGNTSGERNNTEKSFTNKVVDVNTIAPTGPSRITSIETQTSKASEESQNENNINESDEFDYTTKSMEVITDDDLSVGDISTENADITQYVDGRNNLTLYNTDAITGRPPLDDQTIFGGGSEEVTGVGVAVGVSVIGLISLALLIALLVVVRRRSSRGGYGRRCTPVSLDACSVGSVPCKGRSLEKSSYGNPAYENEVVVSHPMRVSALASFAADAESVWGEFSELQAGCGAGMGAVPQGCEDKNRYANVLPLAETRVPLSRLRDDPNTEYINANYVSGPGNIKNYYIACQAPMANTVVDFWRMIWEQNSRLILMLTEYTENGIEKCYEYLPPSEVSDNKRTFGDFQVVLKKREHREKYAASTLELRHVPSGVWRELHHMWYFWPAKGVPEDYESVIDFLSECRGHMKVAQLGRDYAEGRSGAPGDDSSDGDGEVHTYSPLQEQERVMRARANGNTDAGNAARGYGQATRAGTNVRATEKSGAGAGTGVPMVSAVRPCVVHCSAGAGRTGAVLAVESCARALESHGACDVPRAVRHLRAQRPQSVQNKHQYMFIYKVLSEYGKRLSGDCFDTI